MESELDIDHLSISANGDQSIRDRAQDDGQDLEESKDGQNPS